MTRIGNALPDPAQEAVAMWLRTLDRSHLQGSGWTETDKRFHGIAMAARHFVHDNFTTTEQQEAAFDGLALGLLAMAHFGDISRLSALFESMGLREGAQKDQPVDNNLAG